jgi:hypothetical protein
LAWGFNVDFSEDNEPIDELGDKPGPLEAGKAPARSEFDDAELPGRPREFTGCISTAPLADATPSNSWPGELVFLLFFEKTWDEGVYAVVLEDSLPLSDSFFLSSNDLESTEKNRMIIER